MENSKSNSLDEARARGFPRLFSIELEYAFGLFQAEKDSVAAKLQAEFPG